MQPELAAVADVGPRSRVHAKFENSQLANQPFWPVVSEYTTVNLLTICNV